MSDIKRPGECCPGCKHTEAEAVKDLESSGAFEEIGAFLGTSEGQAFAAKLQADAQDRRLPTLNVPWLPPGAITKKSSAFDYDFSFHAEGKGGDVVVLSFEVEHLCRILKKLAMDTCVQPGLGTRVLGLKIAGKSQFPLPRIKTQAQPKPLTAFFTDGSLGCGVMFDKCPKGSTVELEIEFLVDCTFEATFFCKAVR